tara:strand:+ start:5835 stop:9284 length:3450 start_codon:yes stop_codon:yes gene_type:complete
MAILSKGTTYADGDQITSTNLNALVDSATFAAGAVESGGGVQLNGSGQLKVGGNVDIGTSNLTATGTISLGATTFNDNNITNVGSIAVDSIIADNTDVEIDAAGDITLDAGGADIRLKDDGTQFGRLANSSSNLVVASSVSDKDILFQGSDGGSTITALTLDMSAAGAATFNDKITAVGTSVFTNLDISGDVDVDGTINLDAVDIDGNVQIDGTVTVGVDDTGYDVKFFGATSGAYIQFDASADKLLTAGGATVDIVKDKLLIGGTAVTTTAAELNFLDGATANTVVNSKAVIYGSGGQVAVTSLSGALANGVTATTQSANDNSTKVATTAYVDAQVTAEDLDFAGDSGSGSVDLDSQTFTIAGSTGIDTTASSQTLTVSLDLNELATETSIAQDDFVAMVDNTDSGNGKITFSNLEDEIFGNVSGAVSIAAGGAATVSAVTVADESSDTTCFPLFATAATGSLGPKSGSNLTFNSSSGLLTATTLSGILADGVTATTQSNGDNSTKVATTAYVDAATGGGEGGAFTTLTASDDVNFDSGTFFVDASANRVGIGTTSPSGELHVNSAAANSDIYISSGTTSDAIIALQTDTGGSAREARIGYDYSASLLKIINGASFSGATTGINIDTSGNVGIKNASPSVALDVTGELELSSHATLGSNLYLKRDTDAWTSTATWLNVSDFGILNTGGSFALTLNGNGYRSNDGDWTSFGNNSLNGATQIWQYPAGYITFNTNSSWATGSGTTVTERVRIDSSGQVGINDSSPSYMLDVNGTARVVSTLRLDANTANYAGAYDIYRSGAGYLRHRIADQTLSIGVTNTSDTVYYPIVIDTPNDVLKFNHEGGEMARFDTDGNLGLGVTSPSVLLHVGTGSIYQNKTGSGAFPGLSDTTSHGFMAESQGSSGSSIHVSRTDNAAGNFARQGTGDVIVFRNTDTSVTEAGSVEITGASSVAYRTSSDYRLKENVVDVTDGIDRVKQLNPVRFNFIGEDPVLDGFLAHEVQNIVPEAISGTKDGMKDEEYEVSPAVYEDVVHPAVEAVYEDVVHPATYEEVVHPAVEATYDEDGNELTPAQEEWTERVLLTEEYTEQVLVTEAQEEWTESVLVTEAVMGTRTVPDYQGIDQSKLVPLLTAALQEAVAKIEALEARVQTLEG